MTHDEISALLARQQAFYRSGETLPVAFRIAQLKKLHTAIRQHESAILAALREDLGKSSYEGFMCETGLALTEISHMLRHVRRYAGKRYAPTPLSQFPARSWVQPMPYGNTLIMSPWNYPFLLTIEPLADAIAAGNTAIVKPSAYAPATSAVIAQIIGSCFPEEYVAVVTGGREENAALLGQPFDMVFFTGSTGVGREVLHRCAEHLTPAVLELGGKSPCIVDETADIPLAARRIVWGKFLNCGQTCVAPDYVLCAASVQEPLTKAILQEVQKQFGESPLDNPHWGKIVNRKHFERLTGLIDQAKVILGGTGDPETCRIAPTVMSGVTREDAVMQEEIFGPILPILTYDGFDDLMTDLFTRLGREKPLALYLFSRDEEHISRVTQQLPYGGGCVNDVVIHLATSAMPFGGVGASGMGSYHGRAGFDAFSHRKSIVRKANWLDLPMRYQPFTSRVYERLLRVFLK